MYQIKNVFSKTGVILCRPQYLISPWYRIYASVNRVSIGLSPIRRQAII